VHAYERQDNGARADDRQCFQRFQFFSLLSLSTIIKNACWKHAAVAKFLNQVADAILHCRGTPAGRTVDLAEHAPDAVSFQ
jgi:hypothetical protein